MKTVFSTAELQAAQDPELPEVHIVFARGGGPGAVVRSGTADLASLRTPADLRGLDTEVLLAEPRVAVLPAGHRLTGRRRLRRADLAGEPMPRWAEQVDAATAAYWTGSDTPAAPGPAQPEGPEISDMNQLLDRVALGQAVGYVPVSVAWWHSCAELVFVPVSDLSPSEVVVAWPDTSRSRSVARFCPGRRRGRGGPSRAGLGIGLISGVVAE